MAKKTVLAIGIDPSFVDYGAFPGLTVELVGSYIETQIERLRALGFEAQSCLIDLGDTAEAVAATALRSRKFDCVVIGPDCASRRSVCTCSKRSSISFTCSRP